MRTFFAALGPCLVFPVVLFVALHYPALDAEVDRRLPLLPVYDIAHQLEAEITYAAGLHKDLPANFGRILSDYGKLVTSDSFLALKRLSASHRQYQLPERVVTSFIAWTRNLPPDILTTDPVGTVLARLDETRKREDLHAQKRDQMLFAHALDCLKYGPPPTGGRLATRIALPPETLLGGLRFCGEAIPLGREDVRRRIEHQINYLLTDFRNTTEIWLRRKDRYGAAIEAILLEEGMPREFVLLPALESGYSSSVVSPSMAAGWWQFLKATAVNSLSGSKDLDWSLQVDQWKDERRDLVLSTRAAARYLKWIRLQLSNGDRQCGWLMTAAAYNAGFAETSYRINAYDSATYWDVKLPRETEDYVPRWVALWIIDSHRRFYGLDLPAIAPVQFETLEKVRLAKDLPLELLATLTSSSVRFMKEINGTLRKGDTGFRAKRSGVDRTHNIHVPKGSKQAVLKALRQQGYVNDGA